jgi:hypothetical protein
MDVPAILKLAHARVRVWFLPLYLPRGLQWPACFVMIVLGVAVVWVVISTHRRARTCGATGADSVSLEASESVPSR